MLNYYQPKIRLRFFKPIPHVIKEKMSKWIDDQSNSMNESNNQTIEECKHGGIKLKMGKKAKKRESKQAKEVERKKEKKKERNKERRKERNEERKKERKFIIIISFSITP